MEIQFFDASLTNKIGRLLLAKTHTVSVAESVTSGLLQFALSGAENAQKFYQGGITAYNLGQKVKHLNVEPINATACNCVSQKTADEMAMHVTAVFNSDWGIGITGYATPVPESNNKVFAYYSIVFRNMVRASARVDLMQRTSAELQIRYVNEVLQVMNHLITT